MKRTRFFSLALAPALALMATSCGEGKTSARATGLAETEVHSHETDSCVEGTGSESRHCIHDQNYGDSGTIESMDSVADQAEALFPRIYDSLSSNGFNKITKVEVIPLRHGISSYTRVCVTARKCSRERYYRIGCDSRFADTETCESKNRKAGYDSPIEKCDFSMRVQASADVRGRFTGVCVVSERI